MIISSKRQATHQGFWGGFSESEGQVCNFQAKLEFSLGGPAAILFIARDAFHSDSITKLLCVFLGQSHNYRATGCKMGYRTDGSV